MDNSIHTTLAENEIDSYPLRFPDLFKLPPVHYTQDYSNLGEKVLKKNKKTAAALFLKVFYDDKGPGKHTERNYLWTLYYTLFSTNMLLSQSNFGKIIAAHLSNQIENETESITLTDDVSKKKEKETVELWLMEKGFGKGLKDQNSNFHLL